MFVAPISMVYIFLNIFFARVHVCPKVSDFNSRNQFLSAKLLKNGYRYHEIHKAL